MKIKGIDVSCLSKRQQKTMKEHSKHHTGKHISDMVKKMCGSSKMSFTGSHKSAMSKIGK
jgi:hypothetical protein|tara:strand:- start:14011 stop:14190 length:180 start_codon:yes stop_codon:yes gene_type:complete